VPTTLIAGPPGSGKTTYAQQNARDGDLIIDVDRIFAALSGRQLHDHPEELLPFVLGAREGAEACLMNESELRHAWILRGAPSALDREYYAQRGAEVIVLDVSADECLRRVMADPNRHQPKAHWEQLIVRWWENYHG
jgi:predicted kinase